MNQRPAILLLLTAVIATLTACGSTPPSKYLGDTSKFAPDSTRGGALVYRHPSKSPRDYKRVWVDTLEVHFANPSDEKEIDAKAMKEFITFWRSEAESHVKSRFELATGPGESTLRLRMALTGIQPAKPGQMFTPINTPTRLDMATATLEAEALDSQTQERVFALIDDSATRRPAGTDRLDHAKKTIKDWLDRLFVAR